MTYRHRAVRGTCDRPLQGRTFMGRLPGALPPATLLIASGDRRGRIFGSRARTDGELGTGKARAAPQTYRAAGVIFMDYQIIEARYVAGLCFANFAYFASLRETALSVHRLIHTFSRHGPHSAAATRTKLGDYHRSHFSRIFRLTRLPVHDSLYTLSNGMFCHCGAPE